MPIEQAFEELKKYAQELIKVGDAKQALASNKDEFIHKWGKVNQYYKYIIKNVPLMSDQWFEAIDVLSDVSQANPSLEEWIEEIITPKNRSQVQSQQQREDTIDPATISGTIESLIAEINGMQSWDPEHVGDLEWQLRQYQEKLIANQGLFDSNAYQSLMSDIQAALDKIGRFNDMVNSDLMENVNNYR